MADSRADFDFIFGRWLVHNRELRDVTDPHCAGRRTVARGSSTFECDDVIGGQPVRVRFEWTTDGADGRCRHE